MLAWFGLDGKNTKTAGVGGMQGLNEKKLRIAEVGVHFRGLARTIKENRGDRKDGTAVPNPPNQK